MKQLIKNIFELDVVKNNPPVLLDIGASGNIHPIWKDIAAGSICIAFDADMRDFEINIAENSGFRKLYKINSIVSDVEQKTTQFFLTASPHCSSTLAPREEDLSPWVFASKFKPTEKIELNSITLSETLKKLNIPAVDWFKTDSQGTDLRLFKSLDSEIRKNILVAEFEPGIIDAYYGEDKMYEVLKHMESEPFWLSDMVVKGSKRIKETDLANIISSDLNKKLTEFALKTSPGWAELSYINTFRENPSLRQLLLGWVFSSILNQHGFAYTLAKSGVELKLHPIFQQLTDSSAKQIKKAKFSPSILYQMMMVLKKKILN